MRERFSLRAQSSRRRLLAQEAARLMTSEGIGDYAEARRLAAARLGVASRRFWPSDEEILDAAHEWQRIYRSERSRIHLNRLRRLACEAMEFLGRFAPRLTGCVAAGTAGEHSVITLEVFADPAEEVLKRLCDAGIPYTVHGTAGRGEGVQGGGPASDIRFLVDGVPLELRVWPAASRQQLSANRKKSPRLTRSELVRLLEAEGRD